LKNLFCNEGKRISEAGADIFLRRPTTIDKQRPLSEKEVSNLPRQSSRIPVTQSAFFSSVANSLQTNSARRCSLE
jgi:hypothetical protein